MNMNMNMNFDDHHLNNGLTDPTSSISMFLAGGINQSIDIPPAMIGRSIPVHKPTNAFKRASTEGKQIHNCHHPGCKYQTQYVTKLNLHLRTHTGEKPYPCEMEGCSYRSARKDTLKAHVKRHHINEKTPPVRKQMIDDPSLPPSKRKIHNCQYPGCHYQARGSTTKLAAHHRTHTGEKPFHCEYEGCNYAASRKDILKSHQRKHHLGATAINTGNLEVLPQLHHVPIPAPVMPSPADDNTYLL